MARFCSAPEAIMTEMVVVGAGAFGAWTALCLAEAGPSVTLIDMFGAGNDRSSSGGESRNIRAAYGYDAFYTRWARRAWARWREREAEFGTRLLYPSGSLRPWPPAEMEYQAGLFQGTDIPFEILSPEEVFRRWPQMNPGPEPVFYEPDSGILAAARTLLEVERAFGARGGKILRGRARLIGKGSAAAVEVNGAALSADVLVLACGPWLPQLLPELLGPLIRTPRRELLFVSPTPDDPRFAWDRCPNLVDELGWTSADIGNGVKIAPPMKGIDMDPDEESRLPTPSALQRTRTFLAARLPALAQRPFVSCYVSQLENTANEDFVIDRHPEAPHVIIAGGGSGHAFKFGPLLGEYVAQMAIEGTRGAHPERFGLQCHRALRPGEAG